MSKRSGVPGKTVLQQARSIGAVPRRERREARTAAEQLALLDERPGKSARERMRLRIAIERDKDEDG